MKLKEPTLKEMKDHMEKNGGYLKGRGDGRVEWVAEETPAVPSFSKGVRK